MKPYLTPLTVLLSALLISAAVYLRPHSEVEHGRSLAGEPRAAGPAQQPPTIASPPAIPQASPGPDIVADLTRAWEKKRPSAVQECWLPLLAVQPEPATTRVDVTAGFSPDGKQIGWAVGETRGVSRADVAQCLRELPLDLVIPPPGRHAQATIAIEFP